MADEKTQIIDYREVGATGLKRFSGFVFEDFLQELIGQRAVAVYKEMSSNDPVATSIVFAIKMLARRVPWRTESASDHPNDKEASEFLETCMNDMSETWIDLIDSALSFIVYGYSVHETCYKRRCGDVFDPTMRSKHKDGRIGWRKFPIRSQDTIYRWQFDDHGGIQGVEQLAPPHYYHVTIPVEKILLFRTTVEKNNPEGRSLLRGAYRPWYMKKNIENIEAIGIERDLAGLPVALVPPELLSTGASQDQKNLLSALKDIVVNIRNDAQAGVIFPNAFDTVTGKPLYELKLMSTGGQRQFDTDKTIQRYDQRIAMTMLSDFMLLGQDKVGSFALASSKTNLFADAIGGLLDIVTDVFNRYAIPRLFNLNDFEISDYPQIRHGDIESVDLEVLGQYIQALATAGYPLFPNAELEKYLMKAANLPEPAEEANEPELQVESTQAQTPSKVVEIPDDGRQHPTGGSYDTTPVNQKPPVSQVITNQTGNTETTTGFGADQETAEALRNMKRINLDY